MQPRSLHLLNPEMTPMVRCTENRGQDKHPQLSLSQQLKKQRIKFVKLKVLVGSLHVVQPQPLV